MGLRLVTEHSWHEGLAKIWIVEEGIPDPDYLETLLRGASAHGLPASYIDWVRALACGDATGAYTPGG